MKKIITWLLGARTPEIEEIRQQQRAMATAMLGIGI